MAYTPYGPWTNGSAPGISAAFLNALENFLAQVNNAATDPNLSSSSGNLTVVGLVLNNGHVVLANNHSLQGKDSSGNAHDILYVDNANCLDLQMPVSGTRIYFKKQDGTNLASIDASGNLRIAGTITQNTTP